MSGFSRVCHLPKVICFALFCLTGLANSYAQSAETQFMRRANRYYNAKAYDKAIEYYEKTLELDSMNTRARYNLGNTYLAQRKPKEAMKEYEKCSAKIGESGQSILVSAHQLVKLGIPKNPKKPLPDIEE